MLERAARRASRDPAGIRRVIQLVGTVTGTPHTTSRPLYGPGGQPIRTTPDVWASIIAQFAADQRFDTVNLILEEETSDQLRLFAAEVGSAATVVMAHGFPRSRRSLTFGSRREYKSG